MSSVAISNPSPDPPVNFWYQSAIQRNWFENQNVIFYLFFARLHWIQEFECWTSRTWRIWSRPIRWDTSLIWLTSTALHGVRLTTERLSMDHVTPRWEPSFVVSTKVDADWVTSTSGLVETAVRMTIAIAMDTPLPCGPYPSIRPSTTGKMPTTTRAVHPLWPRLSATEPKIQTLAWSVEIRILFCHHFQYGQTTSHP